MAMSSLPGLTWKDASQRLGRRLNRMRPEVMAHLARVVGDPQALSQGRPICER